MSSKLYSGNIPDWSYDAVRALMQTLKITDPNTYEHCLRVGELARKLSKSMGLTEYEQKVAEFSGLLHDIGKMGVDKEVLLKPGKLDPREMDIMRSHSVLSAEIVSPLTATHGFFKDILPGVRNHHERMDGEGYPDKKIGEAIPLFARVILVVDTYDAMSQTRAYRKGLPDDIVYAEIKRCAGTQFDPQIVRTFLEAHKTWNTVETEQDTLHYIIKKVA